jgi:hypothetical protein
LTLTPTPSSAMMPTVTAKAPTARRLPLAATDGGEESMPLVIDEGDADPSVDAATPGSTVVPAVDAEAMATETEAAASDEGTTEETGWQTRSRRKRQVKKPATA